MNNLPDALSDVEQGLVLAAPTADGLPVGRQQLESSGCRGFPVARPNHDRDHAKGPSCAAPHRPQVFQFPAVVAGEIVRAEQRDEEMRLPQGARDLCIQGVSGLHVPVIPGYYPVALERREMDFKFVPDAGVDMGIGDKNPDLPP